MQYVDRWEKNLSLFVQNFHSLNVFSLALIHISSDSGFIPQINHMLLSLRRVTEVMVIKQIDLKINYEIKFRVSPTFNDKLGKYIRPFTNTLIISHLLVDSIGHKQILMIVFSPQNPTLSISWEISFYTFRKQNFSLSPF